VIFPPSNIDLFFLARRPLKWFQLLLFLDVFAAVCPTAGEEGARVPEIVITARELFA
jgi:hypothetical protein